MRHRTCNLLLCNLSMPIFKKERREAILWMLFQKNKIPCPTVSKKWGEKACPKMELNKSNIELKKEKMELKKLADCGNRWKNWTKLWISTPTFSMKQVDSFDPASFHGQTSILVIEAAMHWEPIYYHRLLCVLNNY
ncbi:hypothetical protein BVC80_7765g5 [Macleaya cordata]|uniref:Uncharacterized protein n=1 Tax=Macleaya cordata TaxID=56857 RepID=A0A200QGA9_MACCD|nr:hypothetical protein BVC80_7765g5 [Macleaya cordata]